MPMISSSSLKGKNEEREREREREAVSAHYYSNERSCSLALPTRYATGGEKKEDVMCIMAITIDKLGEGLAQYITSSSHSSSPAMSAERSLGL